MRRYLFCTLILFVSLAAVAQQDYVGRFDVFTGYTYLATPSLDLPQHGYHTQTGVNLNRWLALGVDYAHFNGKATLVPTQLVATDQAAVGQLLHNPAFAPFFAANPNYSLSVPYNASTWEFAAGPVLNVRKFKAVTVFIHPDLGVLSESVTAKPRSGDLPAITAINALVPGGQKSDKVMFYGVGGGIDFNVSKHMGIRTHFDYVHCFLFENLLASSRNSFRYSIGPTFRFGGNVK